MITDVLLSLKKTRAIKKVVKLTLEYADTERCIQAYKELYDCLHSFPLLKGLCDEFNFTFDDFYTYSNKLRALGLTDAHQDWPYVSIFCFSAPLSYFLVHNEEFDSLRSAAEIYQFVGKVLQFM